MKIKFTGHQLEVTQALRDFTTEKLERLARRFVRVISINVTFTVEKLSHIAEATLHLPGEALHATAESITDMYAAIDILVEKLEKQLNKHKSKETEHY